MPTSITRLQVLKLAKMLNAEVGKGYLCRDGLERIIVLLRSNKPLREIWEKLIADEDEEADGFIDACWISLGIELDAPHNMMWVDRQDFKDYWTWTRLEKLMFSALRICESIEKEQRIWKKEA